MSAIIKSVFDDQDELLANMVRLHSSGVIDVDPCYGRGIFYRHTLEPPPFRFDINPRVAGVAQADIRNLPLDDATARAVMFDPPFLDGAFTARRKLAGNMANKFGSVPGQTKDLLVFYREAMTEIRRILVPAGILYFKCQDIVDGRRNFFTHVEIYNAALELGFRGRDFFLLLAKSRPIQHNLYKQVHARKFHCYFWVFEKRKKDAR